MYLVSSLHVGFYPSWASDEPCAQLHVAPRLAAAATCRKGPQTFLWDDTYTLTFVL